MIRLDSLSLLLWDDEGERLHHLAEAEKESNSFEALRYLSKAADRGYSRTKFETLEKRLRGNPQTPRLHLPLAQQTALSEALRRSCLVANLSCLSPGQRIAFVLVDVLGLTVDQVSDLLDSFPSCISIRLNRARNKLDWYLGPRCQHIHLKNPCSCISNLPVALATGMIQQKTRLESPRKPLQGVHDVAILYQRLYETFNA